MIGWSPTTCLRPGHTSYSRLGIETFAEIRKDPRPFQPGTRGGRQSSEYSKAAVVSLNATRPSFCFFSQTHSELGYAKGYIFLWHFDCVPLSQNGFRGVSWML